ILCPDYIGLGADVDIVDRRARPRHGSAVEDAVDPGHRSLACAQIADIALVELRPGGDPLAAAVDEAIQHTDAVAPCQQFSTQVTANEAGAAGDEYGPLRPGAGRRVGIGRGHGLRTLLEAFLEELKILGRIDPAGFGGIHDGYRAHRPAAL